MSGDIDHVNAKVFAESAEGVDPAAALRVFHRWIREGVPGELLIDVADYRHVPAGPGVMLVGHEANYSLDEQGGRLGLLYNRKAALGDSVEAKIAQALRAAMTACGRLEQAPEYEGRLRFNAGEIEIIINDRLLAPNTEESFRELRPAVAAVLGRTGPAGLAWRLEQGGSDPRERLRIAAHAGGSVGVARFLQAAG